MAGSVPSPHYDRSKAGAPHLCQVGGIAQSRTAEVPAYGNDLPGVLMTAGIRSAALHRVVNLKWRHLLSLQAPGRFSGG